MDKETLSNYGWIVILVLILAVMLALATPFGSFIAGAIKSTTAGLFSVNQAALGSAGIDVNDMVFENCDHLETELRNVTDTYTGDTCCKACGAVMSAGQTVRPKVPEGGKYTAADGTVYGPDDEMPEVVTAGDKYTYGDYKYTYYVEHFNLGTGWHVELNLEVTTKSKTSYGSILESINGKPINSVWGTFYQCTSLVVAPAIPKDVKLMYNTFGICSRLTTAPIIPEGVTNIGNAFYSCGNLVTYANSTDPDGDFSGYIIPNSVSNMNQAFSGCSNLTIAPDMSGATSVTTLYETFRSCKKLIGVPNLSNCTLLTNMEGTFYDCTSLATAPVIPNGVTNMQSTFSNCTSLTTVSTIPNSVIDMGSTFSGCSSLTTAPMIPNGVTDMRATFAACIALKTYTGSTESDGGFANFTLPSNILTLEQTFEGCTSMKIAPAIPTKVTGLQRTFYGCTALITAPVIPYSVSSLKYTFVNCTSLTGTISTLNRPTYFYDGCFTGVDFEAQNLTLVGTSTYVDSIGATGTNYCADCNGKCQVTH